LLYDLLWNSNPTVPVLNPYSDIKNTGKIVAIKNREIRENFTALELTLSSLNSLIQDRLMVQQMRIDDILVNDVNFVRFLNIREPSIDIDDKSQNNYSLILNNQKIRNFLAIKLNLTYSAIINRKEYRDKIASLIELLQIEINSERLTKYKLHPILNISPHE
tara:strand:- start:3068 stop:3553 length:486 start_codon:yes stop_codon:yes gene_type:complete